MINRIVAIAEERPHDVAIVADGSSMTYEELESRTRLVATHLLASNVGRGSVVAVWLPRSAATVIGMLGAARAGAAYTVLEYDEYASKEELARRVSGIAPAVVLCNASDRARLAAPTSVLCIDTLDGTVPAADLPVLTDDDVMYLIFTSGSTGVPKGVAITHGNVDHYSEAIRDRLRIDAPLHYAHVSTFAADLGYTSVFLAFWTRGTLHIVDEHTRRDPQLLLDYLSSAGVDLLKITPSHWSAMFRHYAQRPSSTIRLKFLVLGGETLTPQLARAIGNAGIVETLVNHYGPTETTVGVMANVIRDPASILDAQTTVPIGTPLGRTRAIVMDSSGRIHQHSATGELYLGGPSVGKGYWNDPDATAAAFLTSIEGGERYYRTGDLVSIDEHRVVTFLGRIDRQIKLAGHRIEPEHVEVVLRSIGGVGHAAVFPLSLSGRTVLAAAVTCTREGLTEDDLRRALQDQLPRPLIPARIVILRSMPLTPNGKIDLAAARAQATAAVMSPTSTASEPTWDETRMAEIASVWARRLGRTDFGPNDNFFDLGGDSLAAIEVIAELQVKGYDVSARAFRDRPTIRTLATAPARRDSQGAASRASGSRHRRTLAPAQSWFFAHRFANPHHWNQAVLLEATRRLDEVALSSALDDVLRMHPLLRTTFHEAADGYEIQEADMGADACLTVSVHGACDDHALAATVHRTSAAVHESINITRGPVCRLHLFRCATQRDHILLVVHHLAVDAISWRIVLDDLVRCYHQRLGTASGTVAPPADFWTWVDQLDTGDQVSGDRALAAANAGAPSLDFDPTEGGAATMWLQAGREHTRLLQRDGSTRLAVHPSTVVLAAFVKAFAEHERLEQVTLDVEGHGRAASRSDIDVSRCVGWFTSISPMTIRVAPTLDELVIEAARATDTADSRPDIGPARICFNYLGAFREPAGPQLGLAFARHPLAAARAAVNVRPYELVFTSRIVNDELTCDLSYPAGRYSESAIRGILESVHRSLVAITGAPAAEPPLTWAMRGSAAGLLAHVPAGLQRHSRPTYRRVLLTGATGFIGIHLMRHLLTRTACEVTCIVRARAGHDPGQRLEDVYAKYFPFDGLSSYRSRYRVVAGDVTDPHLGVGPDVYRHLAANIDAVYHCAADTRLFNSRDECERQNLAPVRTIIDFVRAGRAKDVHFTSTLAVAGVNTAGRPTLFDESSFDIGQEFENEYERSKWRAERLLREFAAGGGNAFIYRAGNVSGDSVTGVFQQRAMDNRFVQLLSTLAAIGEVPAAVADTIRLAPVDVVADAIVGLSMSAQVSSGTFHVDTEQEIAMEEIFEVMRSAGIHLERTAARSFEELFARRIGEHASVALGYFWATRRSRNVTFDCRRTLQLLDRIGCRFPRLGREWLESFIRGLIEQGALSAAVRDRLARSLAHTLPVA
jgi:amino acid adenylation domain-containing protein/thioester reductase-like protein